MPIERMGQNPGVGEQAVAAFHKEQSERIFSARQAASEVFQRCGAPEELGANLSQTAAANENRRKRMGPIQQEAHYIDYLVHFDAPLRDLAEPMGPAEHEALTQVGKRWYALDELLFAHMQSVGFGNRDIELVNFDSWFHELVVPYMEHIGNRDTRTHILGLTQQESIYRYTLQWAAYARSLSLEYLHYDLEQAYPETRPGELVAVVDNVRFSSLNSLYEYVERNGLRENNVRTVERLSGRAFAYPPEYTALANESLAELLSY